MRGVNSHLAISIAVGAGIIIGGCLVAMFMYAFVVQKELVTVQVAVPTSMTFSAPADHAALGTAILHGKLESVSGGTVTFKLSDWILGMDARAQLAIEDGDCTLESVEREDAAQLSSSRATPRRS